MMPTEGGDLRQRNLQPQASGDEQEVPPALSNEKTKDPQSSESEDDDLPVPVSKDNADFLPQASDNTTEALDSALKDLTPRWRNWIIRGIFTWVMILSFCLIIYMGPLALLLVILGLQIKCYHELITIGYVVYRSYDLPWFRTLSWYFLFASNFFFFGESMIGNYGLLISNTDFFRPFITYHRFIAFTLYTGGLVAFVCSLVKKHYLKQFTLFGWTHVTLLVIVVQSHLIAQNLLEGLIWVLVPVSCIICNDIMAYIFGFFFGRTPLIKLSPKKTWEGFIGGAVATIFFGILLSYVLVQYDYFICPLAYHEPTNALSMDCIRSREFNVTEYSLPETVVTFLKVLKTEKTTVSVYPFVLHSIFMAIFASVIGPFGGFFASGFKRAFKIKDFGDTIPGHGGIMDRFDCQFLMATFIHVYYSTFIKVPNPQNIVQNVLMLRPEEQLQVYEMLKSALEHRGLIGF